MVRFALLVAILLSPLLAFAAPVPKADSDAVKFEKRFGKAILPDKKGEFKFADDALTLRFSEKDTVDNNFMPLDCPHTAVEVTGDFEVTVVIRTTAPKLSKFPNRKYHFGGGLVAWDAEAAKPLPRYVRRQFEPNGNPKGKGPFPWMEEAEGFAPGEIYTEGQTFIEKADPTSPLHLRLVRSEGTIAFLASSDGEKWHVLKGRPGKGELPKTLTVGVWGYNASDTPIDVIFEKFAVKPAK